MVNLQPDRALASDAFSRFCREAASTLRHGYTTDMYWGNNL